MKSLLSYLIVLVLTCFQSVKSQEQEPSWVYRVNFENTQEMADSTLSFTKVYIDVNTRSLRDSVTLVFTISSSFGANDILLKKVVYTPSLINNDDIMQTSEAVRFYIGKYVIKPEIPFIVDLGFEYK